MGGGGGGKREVVERRRGGGLGETWTDISRFLGGGRGRTNISKYLEDLIIFQPTYLRAPD